MYLKTDEIKNHFVNILIHEWKIHLQSSTRKLRLYKKLNNVFCYEELRMYVPFYLRNPLMKLRISNHSLRIETGRFN